MKKIYFLFALIFYLNLSGFESFQIRDQLFVQWGEASGQIPLVETSSGWLSLASFEIIGENTHVLASSAGQMLVFSGQNLTSTRETGIREAQDFLFDKKGKLEYVMDSQSIYKIHTETHELAWVNPWKMRPNSYFLRANSNTLAVLLNLSETAFPEIPQNIPTPGVLNRLGDYGRMMRLSDSEMILSINEIELTSLKSGEGMWGSGRYLGCNERGDHYVVLETILTHFPLELRREIQVINSNGKTIAAIEVPSVLHVPVNREFQIQADGSVFELVTTEKGADVVKWEFLNTSTNSLSRAPLPVEFRNIKARPFSGDSNLPDMYESEEKSDIKRDINQRLDFPPVGREESLITAAEYVDLIWTATSANLTNGQITDPAGNALQTPDWIQVGQNQKMPYKWGGFSTIDGFVDGLANGKYAGDIATSDVSQYAVGVDCSGFVCRCWNMTQHYSTRMMNNTYPLITLPYASWYDLKSSDVIHKEGHVRLAVQWNPNGTILAVEATSRGWAVSYKAFALSDLSAYGPRYYIYMEGMPTAIEQPTLNVVANSDSRFISWSFTDTKGIQGVHLYQKNIFQTDDWDLVTDYLIPVNQNYFFSDETDLSIAYQVKAVSDNLESTESNPSDSYATASKGSSEKLLIVDGFDRTTGSYSFSYHDFSLRMAEALGRFTFTYETTNNDAVLGNLINLADYTAVFWLLGDESTQDETFSDNEQSLIENYLVQGGKLFVSGSEIAWDLYAKGTASDQAYLHNYLKASYGADDSESYVINGLSGTSFAGISLNYDDGHYGVYEEDYPDALLATGGSEAVLNYDNNMIAGTAYTGTFGAGTATGQVILLGIPFETIYLEEQRLDLVKSILEYFNLSTTLSDEESINTPVVQLHRPFPSPFNHTTQIGFLLLEPRNIILRIFDIRGRELEILSNKYYEAGTWQLPFTPDGLSDGLYLVQLHSNDISQTQKIIYIKQ